MGARQASKRRRHQQRACGRKQRFGSERAAARAAGARLTFYRCGACHGWHLTKREITS